MKKKNILSKNIALLALILSLFIACEEDFSSIDSDVVNSENTTHFFGDKIEYPIITFNKKITPFQSNNLPLNPLGYYKDDVFGTTTANIVSQMLISPLDPSFGEDVEIEIDSVILTIPYLSTLTETDSDGKRTFRLDSVFGDKEAKIKLSIYENNYFLRSFDPNSDFDENQKYYSNGTTSSALPINPSDLEGELIYEDTDFQIDGEEIILTELNDDDEEEESERLTPSMRIRLDDPDDDTNTYWEDTFLAKENEPELSNQNNFFDYFRGLYFKVEPVNSEGPLMLLNFRDSKSNITVFYKTTKDDPDNDDEQIVKTNSFRLNFTGNIVSLLDNNFGVSPNPDPVNGDERLYLKGGEGNMAVIDLFNGDIENEESIMEDAFDNFLRVFRDKEDGVTIKKRLINEAFIEFYVDQSQAQQGDEPDRVYIYRADNNAPLVDYVLDLSVDDALNEKISHLQPLIREEGEDGKGIKYKIRITDHLNDIYVNDSTNVKLGLVVTSRVNAINPFPLLDENDENINAVPIGALLSPRGTVLHGNNSSDPEKRAKLTIYYTEPEN